MNKKKMVRTMWAGIAMFSLLTLLAACGGGGDSGGAAGTTGTIILEASGSTIPADGSSSVIIKATIKDSAGNPVRHFTEVTFTTTLGHFKNGSTSFTMQTQPPLNEKGFPDIKATPTGIAEVTFIGGHTGGSAKVTASSIGVTQSVYVTVTGGSAGITLTADPTSIPADGKSSTTITATLTDNTGKPVTPGTQVTFTTGLGHFLSDSKSYTVSTPDSTGVVKVSLNSGLVPGSTYLSARSNGINQSIRIVFLPAGRSSLSLSANPSTIPADGVSTSLVKATVKDLESKGIPNVPVTFYDVSGGEPKPLPPANTYEGTGPEITPTFYSNGGSTGFTMTHNGSSNFVIWLWNKDTNTKIDLLVNEIGPVDKAVAVLDLEKGNYFFEVKYADGDWTIEIDGNITPTPASLDVIVLAITSTDSKGEANYTYTSTTKAEQIKIKVETGEVSNSEEALSQEVIITQTGLSPASVYVAANPSQIYANGASKSTINATATDINGNIVSDGTVVYFSATVGTIGSIAKTVDGVASVTLVSIVSSTSVASTVTAQVGSLSDSTTVTFIGVGLTDMQAAPSTLFANGTDTSEISVRIRDANALAVAGQPVTFTTTSGTIQTATVTTDSNGIAKTTLIAPTTAGTATVTAVYGLLKLTTTVTFVAPFAVGTIKITADPATIPADGASSTAITVEIKDTQNAPVPKLTSVTLTTGLGDFPNGQKSYTLLTPDDTGIIKTSLQAGAVPGTTYIVATSNDVSQALSIVFTNTDPLFAEISIIADPSRIPADGKSQSVITATVTQTRDLSDGKPNAAGQPIPGIPITFYKITANVEPKPLPEGNTYKGEGTSIAGPFYSYGGVTTFWILIDNVITTPFTLWLFNPLSGERQILVSRQNISYKESFSIATSLLPGKYQLEIQTSSSCEWQIKVDGNIGPAQTGKTVLGFGKTDANGKAAHVYTADWLPGSFTVKAETGELSNSANALSAETILTQTSGAPGPIEISAASNSLYANGVTNTSITAQVWTQEGNKAPDGTVVNFSATSGTITPTAVTVDGLASAQLTSIASISTVVSKVTATVGADSASTNVTFVGVTLIDMEGEPATIFANGKDTSKITVRLRDASGTAVDGETIAFMISSGAGSLKASSAFTNSDGIATVDLIAPIYAGVGVVTASYGLITASTAVTYVGEPTVGSISLSANPITIPADGKSTSIITADIRDTANAPVPKGTSVTFTTSLGKFSTGLTYYTVITPDATGRVQVSLISATTAGSALVTATSNNVTQSIYVGFGGAPVKIVLTADPDEIWADGVSSSAIQAKLTDASGAPVTPGTLITFTTNLGKFPNGLQSITVPTPDNTGIVTVSLIAGTATGSAKVSAKANGVEQSVYVDFIEKGGDPFTMTLSADPTILPADGTSSSKIMATLKDSAGNPVKPGTSVTFSTTLGKFSNGLKVITVPTPDATGVVSVSLIAGTTAGSATLTATSDGVTQTVYVTFTGAVVGSIDVTATPDALLADGVSTSAIRAEVRDGQGNPIADGEPISFTIISGTGTLSAATATTIGGFVSVTFTASTTPGQVVIQTMSSNNVSDSVTITLISSPVGTIGLTASPSSIPADGASSSAITAEVLDGAGRPVTKGTLVTFTTTLGTFSNATATITVPTVDDTGTATVSLIAASTPATALVTAASGGVSQTVLVSFTGGVGSVTLTANPTSIPADGTSSSTITAEVRNPSGNMVPAGTSVTFTTTLGKFSNGTTTITATTVGTTGRVSVSLIAANTPGSARVTATADGITQAVYVGMDGAPVIIALTADPTTIPADGSSSSVITAVVKDGSGNPVTAGTAVIFTTTFGTFSNGATAITAYTGIDAQGNPTGQTSVSLIAAAIEGVALVTASSNGVSQSVTVTFTGGIGTITLTASPSSLPADGASSSAVTAIVRNGAGDPVPVGTSVTFTTTLGTFSNGTKTIIVSTLADTGIATVSLIAAATPGTATVTASSGGVSQTTKVTFIGGGQPASLTLSSNKKSVKSDNSDSATITATLLDGNNAPIAGFVVAFSTDTGQISASSATTDANGQAKITFSAGINSTNRIATITATVAATPTPLTANIPIEILGSTLTLTTDRTTIPEDGSVVATLTSTIKDGGGSPVEGEFITFTVTGAGGATVTPASGTTDASGTLQVTVTGTAQGQVTVTANWGGTTADQQYNVTPAADTFAIVLPAATPFTTKTRTVATLVTTPDNATIAFNDNGAAPDTITSAGAFGAYAAGDQIMVGGSLNNDGAYTISDTIPPTANTLTLVSTDALTTEAAGSTVTVTNGVLVRVRAPDPINTVVFSTTIGVWDGGASPIVPKPVPVSNYVWAVLTSTLAGTATVQVYDEANPSTSDKTTVVFSVPSGNAAQLALQSNVYTVPPSIGGTKNTATLTATVRTSLAEGSQVVSGVAVAFSIVNPTGGGEYVEPVVSITDSAGQAKATFTSGSLSSGAEGVTISAYVVASPAITDTVAIVIGGTAGSVVIGRGTVIYDLDDATYRLPMAALVTDSNGNAVSGAVVTLSAWPLQYAPGIWYDSDPDPKAELYKVYYTGTFINNEDVNENLILDPGEDKDGDGLLTPASSSAGGVPVPSQVTTGANGVAAFDLIYLKANAAWIKTRIRARTFVVGSETTSSVEMVLPPEKTQAETGLLPDSPFPIGLVTDVAQPVDYTFPKFYGTGDAFTTSANLSAGESAMGGPVDNYDYTYEPGPFIVHPPFDAKVGDIVWDYILVRNGPFLSAFFPVRIIIQ